MGCCLSNVKKELELELIEACKNCDHELIKNLLKDVSVNILEKNTGKTLLHLVCESNETNQFEMLEICKTLILHGIIHNTQDFEGNTAIHYLAIKCYRYVIRELVLNGSHLSIFIANLAGKVPANMVNEDEEIDYDEKCETSHLFLQLQYAPLIT